MVRHWETWDKKEVAFNWLLAKKDPYHCLTTFVYTTDPHDPDEPVKLFPQKSYIENLVSHWLVEPLLLIPKSRQMLISWTCVALYLWDTMFRAGRFNYFQSAKEEKADKLVRRAHFIWKMLPAGLRPMGVYTYCRLRFPELESSIEGVPQGADAIRQETCSGIFSDEMAFQEEAEAAFIAAKPTIDGGGRYTGVSSANGPNFFKRLVFDEE